MRRIEGIAETRMILSGENQENKMSDCCRVEGDRAGSKWEEAAAAAAAADTPRVVVVGGGGEMSEKKEELTSSLSFTSSSSSSSSSSSLSAHLDRLPSIATSVNARWR